MRKRQRKADDHGRPARAAPTPRTAAKPALPRLLFPRMGLLLAALLISALAVLSAWSTWQRLPLPSVERLDRDALDEAFQNSRQNLSLEARTGLVLAAVGVRFTTAWRDPASLGDALEFTRSAATGITRTQLGRLYLAALVLRQLEHDGVPIEEWPTRIEPYLAGLDNAALDHFLPTVQQVNTTVYQGLGLRPATAYRIAESGLSNVHGPFLEYLVQAQARLAQAAPANSRPAATEALRRVTRRLLRSWVIEPGPTGLRLLAADLLARDLAAESSAGQAPHAELVDGLKAWRAAYRTAAANRPASLSLLNISRSPEVAPEDHDALEHCVYALLWLAAAVPVLTAFVALGGVFWVTAGASTGTAPVSPGRGFVRALLHGAALAIAVLLAALLWWHVAGPSVANDLHGLGAASTGWPRLIWAAGSVVIILLAIGGAWPAAERGWRGQVAHLGRAAVLGALAIACALLINTGLTSYHLLGYETRAALALQRGEFPTIAGPDADARLDPLRAWNP